MTRRYRSKTERLARERLARNLRKLEEEGNAEYVVRDLCPDAWRTLEEDLDVEEKKVKVTLLLDHSVATFYRAMGRGYQARINRILATWAQMRICRIEQTQKEFEIWQKTGKFRDDP